MVCNIKPCSFHALRNPKKISQSIWFISRHSTTSFKPGIYLTISWFTTAEISTVHWFIQLRCIWLHFGWLRAKIWPFSDLLQLHAIGRTLAELAAITKKERTETAIKTRELLLQVCFSAFCVCVCVSVAMCAYVCVYICMYIYIYVYVHICIYIYVYICIYIYDFVCLSASLDSWRMHAHLHIYIYTHMYIILFSPYVVFNMISGNSDMLHTRVTYIVLQILRERMYDVNAFTRSKVLQVTFSYIYICI
jgi:hypothetical protein